MSHKEQVKDHIIHIISRIAKEKGNSISEIDAETVLLGEGLLMDSIDLATLVVELEDLTGKDPFKAGFIEFQTVDELASLYCD